MWVREGFATCGVWARRVAPPQSLSRVADVAVQCSRPVMMVVRRASPKCCGGDAGDGDEWRRVVWSKKKWTEAGAELNCLRLGPSVRAKLCHGRQKAGVNVWARWTTESDAEKEYEVYAECLLMLHVCFVSIYLFSWPCCDACRLLGALSCWL